MKFLVVAANNNEDTKWVRDAVEWTPHVFTNLRPPGREADTYLYWIIKYYGLSFNEVVFCHGYPFDHDPQFLAHLNDDSVRYYGMTETCDDRGMPRVEWCPLEWWCRILGLPPQPTYIFVAGAQYRLTREQVIIRSLDFYKTLYYLTKIQENRNPEEFTGQNVPESRSAYVLERIWPLIWNLNLP